MGEYKLVWYRAIPGYDRYFAEAVSGKIYSKTYRHSDEPHEIKPFSIHRKESKYKGVNLWKNGEKGPVIPVHKIIAMTFPEICGEMFEGAVVNHKDENPENNSAFNLEFCTNEYNCQYSLGYKIEQVKDGKVVGTYPSTLAAERAGVARATSIQSCLKGKLRQTGGFEWRRIE